MTYHISNTTHAFFPYEDRTGVNDPTFLLVAWPTVDQLPYTTKNGIHDDVRLLHGLYDQVVAGGLHDAVARKDRQQTQSRPEEDDGRLVPHADRRPRSKEGQSPSREKRRCVCEEVLYSEEMRAQGAAAPRPL
jgi:hypothetical protein